VKDRRKWLFNVLRVVFGLALLYVAYRLIHFHDLWVVQRDGLKLQASEVRDEGSHWRVRADGAEQVLPKEGTKVEFREGFLSLFRRMDRRLYFLISPLLLVPLAVAAFRWYLLLRASGFEVRYSTILRVTYLGAFFNNFLPGSVGGDIARGVIAAKGEDRKAALAATILLDRLVGLAAMIVMAAVCVAPLATDPRLRIPVLLVGGGLVGLILAYVVYFSRTIRNLPFLRKLKGAGKVGKIARDLDATFHLVKERKGVAVQCALLSVLAQILTIGVIFGLARGLGVTQVTLLQFFIFEPIIFILTAIPVSPGGWGVQEGAYALLFGLVDVPRNQAIAISILYKLTLVFLSLPGGILFALGGARRRRESGARTEIDGPTGDVPAHE